MPVDSFSDTSVGGSRATQRSVTYPSPFFDIASTYFPETPKALFQYCRYYYYTVSVIGTAIDIHAGYPITDIVIDEDDKVLRDRWHDIIHDKFHLKSFLYEAGKDKFTMGNCLISFYIPFKRFLICRTCNQDYPIDTIQWEFKKWVFQAKCNKCGEQGKMDVKDEIIKNLDQANLVRWSPENIDIDYNPVTGRRVYKYKLTNELKKQIVSGRKHVLETMPLEFIEAAKDNLPIIFNPKNIFHMRRGCLAEKNMGWGEPAMIRVLKDTFYLQILKKAREQVAQEHIVPLWVIFPQANGELNPYEHINLAEWRGRIEDELKKWRQDKNYVPIMPFPVGFQFIGGTFKNLDTTPEMQNLLLNILAGMGMQSEFVYGGSSYTGTSFSVRMLANQMASHRSEMLEFVNGFFIPMIAETFEIKKVKTHFTELKFADDVQRKTLFLQLNAQNKLSTGTLLSELGLDANVELQKIKDELKNQGEVMAAQMVEQEKAKAKAMIENIKGQIRAQIQQQAMAAEVQMEMEAQNVSLDPTQPFRISPNLFSSIFKAPPGDDPYHDEQGKDVFVIDPVSVPKTVMSLAKSLMAANEKRRAELMSEMEASMPGMAQMVSAQMQTIGAPGNSQVLPPPQPPGVDMRPMPEQKPPRRKSQGN